MKPLSITVEQALEKAKNVENWPKTQEELHNQDKTLISALPTGVTLVNESSIEDHIGSIYKIYLGLHPDLDKFDTDKQMKAILDLGGEIEVLNLKMCSFSPLALLTAQMIRIINSAPNYIENDIAFSDQGKKLQNEVINLLAEKEIELIPNDTAKSILPESNITIEDALFHRS